MFDGAAENNNTTTTATAHHHHRRFVSSHPLNFLGGAAATSPAFPGFDAPFHSHHHHHQQQQQQQLPLHHRPAPKDERIGEAHGGDGFLPAAAANLLELERDATAAHPWSNEEVGALLKIGSSIENWFPDFTWDHVSRKLAELGFKRSAEKCRGKFEEESRYFNSINTCSAVKNTSNQTFFIDDLEDLYHGPTPTAAHETQQRSPPKSVQNARDYQHYDGEGEKEQQEEDEQQQRRQQQPQNLKSESNSNKNKRKRSTQNRYDEMLKGLCENVVRVMMARQEEMHKKLLEDMVRRDEEKLAREEAWKKQEMERLDEVVEMRAQEQAVAGTRQSTIIQLLNKFTHSTHNNSILSNDDYQDLLFNATTSSPSSSLVTKAYYNKPLDQAPTTSNPNTSTAQKSVDLGMPASSSPKLTLAPRNHTPPQPQNPGSDQGDEQGKRWPREEVLSLINLRCSVHSNVGGDQDSKEGAVTAKVPLWERVSQKMWELGYKRSAKRCKEKWENINKYFRKTKDNIHKKRSLDSRTCPYFHQLSTLYGGGTSQGKGPLGIAGSAGSPEQRSTAAPSENGPEGSFRAGSSSSTNTDDEHVGHVHGGGGSSEKGMAHLSVFDFEF